MSNARVVLDSAREVRSDSAGRFTFTRVSAGRRRVEVFSLGQAPVSLFVVAVPQDTARLDIPLQRVTQLDSVNVIASTVRETFVRDYVDRKRMGIGTFMDSTEIHRANYVHEAVQQLRGVHMYKGLIRLGPSFPGCLPNIFVDNVYWGTEQDMLDSTRPEDVMAVEIYTGVLNMPPQFLGKGTASSCGSIVLWTRRNWPGR